MDANAGADSLRRIGPHLPLGGGLRNAAERAREIGATAIQIFTDNPTAWRRRRSPPADLDEFRERLRELDIGPLAVHAPYLVNLCGNDPVFWEQSIATLVNELRVGAAYGARFVNVHIGSHRGTGRAAGIGRLVDGMARVLEHAGDDWPVLVLENSAGTGDGIGSSLDDLGDIQDEAAAHGLPLERFAFCLDTAHLWGAGYDLSRPAGTDRILERVDRLLGAGRVAMLHLNDARMVRGSRVDRHQHIGAGMIGYAGLRHLLLHPRLAGVPTYLETPGMDTGFDAVNLERVRRIIAGEALPELPPEAPSVRGTRSRSAPPAEDAEEAVA